MEADFYHLIQKRETKELTQILSCNDKSSSFGLMLNKEEAKELALSRNQSLKKYERIEFGGGILETLIDTFCDSQYLNQDNYLETLTELQDIFYQFKNESQDCLTDAELMNFMKEQFEQVCMGDTDYLRDTCLSRFVKAIRSGYNGYMETGGKGEYEQFSEEQRWDKELYLEVLRELCWR